MLEKSAYDFGSLLHVPPHGPCGAFGAGQPWAPNARSRDPLDKRGLASGFLRKKCGVKRPTYRIRVGFSFVGALCVARLKRIHREERSLFRKARGGFPTA